LSLSSLVCGTIFIGFTSSIISSILLRVIDGVFSNNNCGDFDKYGRLLVKVWNMVDEKSINDIMVEENHGRPYFGKTKEKW
jgi:hypothetical protein